MTGSFCVNYQHIVFRCRRCFIQQGDLEELHAYIAGVLRGLGVMEVKVGGINDHVHIFGRFGFMYLPGIVRACKFSATRWLKKRDADYYTGFHWQKRFGSFSVSPGHVERVRLYIANQERHHRHQSTHDEILWMVETGQCPEMTRADARVHTSGPGSTRAERG